MSLARAIPRVLTGSSTADATALRRLGSDRDALEQTLKNFLWRGAYRSWPEVGELQPGYTLILPVPGDLPVFLQLALATARLQDPHGRLETIVVPDRMTPAIGAAFAAAEGAFDGGPLSLVTLGARSRAFQRLAAGGPSKNHFLQVHAALERTRTTHAVLHDADLFIQDPAFLRHHYERAVQEELACLGVSECWDPWLREHGFGHVVATWELLVDVGWMRGFAPWEHRPHHSWLDGEWHGFDLTLRTQASTPAAEVGRNDAGERFEHFNWVISTYRHFQAASGTPFEDRRFVLLLVRLLADGLAVRTGDAGSVDLPPIESLVRGIDDPVQPITYGSAKAVESYPEFRLRVSRILDGPLFDDAAAERIDAALRPFDAAFAFSAVASS